MKTTDEPIYYSCELCAWNAQVPCPDHGGRAIWFMLRPAKGPELVGVVQGCGGLVGNGISAHVVDRRGKALERMRKAIERAGEGKATGLYEPDTGCALFFPEYTALGNGREEIVDLRGATISLAEEPGR